MTTRPYEWMLCCSVDLALLAVWEVSEKVCFVFESIEPRVPQISTRSFRTKGAERKFAVVHRFL